MRHSVNISICFGLFYFFMLTTVSTGYITYFPLTDVHLTFPFNDDVIEILQKNPPFVQVNARLIQDNSNISNKNRFHYEIDDTLNYLSINEFDGKITVGDKIKKLDQNITFTISANVINYTTIGKSNVARMSLKIVPVNISLDECCKDFAKICFWDSAMYAVPENTLNTFVGSFGPNFYRKLCPNYDVKYSLVNSTTHFSIKSNLLFTNTRLDHDSFGPGPSISTIVKCQVLNKLKNQTAVHEKILRIDVLDRNDNPPEIQTDEDINIKLDDPHFRQGAKIGAQPIIFTDKDSIPVNSKISFDILNDTLDIIHPLCNSYETDHLKLKSTTISCKLTFSRSGILSISPYCVGLIATDTSTDRNPNFVSKPSSTKICIVTDVNKIHEHDKPAAQALQSKVEKNYRKTNKKEQKLINTSEETSMSASSESGQSSSERTVVDYPKRVVINRKFTNMARVTKPEGNKTFESSFKFKLMQNAFNTYGVTERGGIVYVKNSSALQNYTVKMHNITVSWNNKFSAKIEIVIDDIVPRYNVRCSINRRMVGCSEFDNKKDCVETCGIGSEGSGCQWRSNNDITEFTSKYATCSPNLTTCPDGYCDPLEQLGEELQKFICPQDCTENVIGPHLTNGMTGIPAATGVCTCSGSTCVCSTMIRDDSDSASKKSEPLTIRKGQRIDNNYKNPAYPQCGVSCIILVVLCPISLSTVIICLVMSRRKYIKKNRKQMEINSSLNERRETETETLTDVPLVSIHTEFTFKNEGDPKWEFPRSQLILDITLGEGEFGKVVKGYATDIGNKPGVTTVAVKMLKNGSNSVELLALLSEYQLLQEVHHPNVIQLLGACTQESPLIIIEYAMYGSLRNYLRLSRKLECSGIEPSNGVDPVTVKDILSFAWQICKGMTYLTEIKLVHRDLAARNVLLAEGKVCKVSDFGLTRDVYEDDAYLKRSKDRVPVKWMAPESLADHVYTTRSDVWAFGILAWELITLGASPYPGIPPQNLYHLLKTGYRMERPENCSEEIYTIIKSCWADDSSARPSFKLLASQWEKLLGNSVKYLELENNAVSNPLYCSRSFGEEERTDDQLERLAEIPQEDLLDHLWRPPSSFDTTNIAAINPMGYDVPRSLIETKTTEQLLRYQNDLTVPLNNNGLYKLPRISQQNIPVDLSHYDSPVKRRKSYVDMSGGIIYCPKT